MNIDLQQRGVEFSQLFGSYNHLRESLLEKMPAMTINKINGSSGDTEITEIPTIERPVVSNGRSNTDTLLDLLGSGDDIIMSTPTVAPTTAITAPAATSNLLDLLGDIDLSAPAVPVMMSNNNNNLTSPLSLTSPILDDNENRNIPDVMNGGSLAGNYDLGGLDFLSTAPTTTASSTARIVTALDKNDLLVQLATSTFSDHLQIIMTTTNSSLETLEEYLFQVSSKFLRFVGFGDLFWGFFYAGCSS